MKVFNVSTVPQLSKFKTYNFERNGINVLD